MRNPHKIPDCKMAKISPADLVLQTDPRLPEYLGIKRWGCYYMDCLAIGQLVTGIILDLQDHRMLYDETMTEGLQEIESVENSIIKPYIPDTEKMITKGLRYLRWHGRAVHIGNENEYLSYATPHRTDFTLVRRLSVIEDLDTSVGYRINGHHFLLGNENAVPIWDPNPGLDLRDDPHFIRIRVDWRIT